jgi:hypothetical protein
LERAKVFDASGARVDFFWFWYCPPYYVDWFCCWNYWAWWRRCYIYYFPYKIKYATPVAGTA